MFLRFSVVFAFSCFLRSFLFLFVFPFRFFCFFRFLSFFASSFFSFQEVLVFSAHFQAIAVDCPSVFSYGETAKTCKKGNFAPTPSTPTPSETF